MSQRSNLRINSIALGNMRRAEEAKTLELPPTVTAAIFQAYGNDFTPEDIGVLSRAADLLRRGGHRAVPKKVIDEAAKTNAIIKAITRATECSPENETESKSESDTEL